MAVSGTLLLTLSFGSFDAGASIVDAMRRALWLTLAGVFGTVAILSSNVWSQVRRRANAPELRAARTAVARADRGERT